MKLKFLGAAHTVTGSCFIIETNLTKIMVDCGMFQGPRFIRERNYKPFQVRPETVDFVLLTHAHIDHSGLIPKLIKHGYRGEVFATKATVALCEVMLPDSGYIQENEVERLNRKNQRMGKPLIEPIYTADDALNSLSRFQGVNYGEVIDLTAEIKVRFNDAGHILGSSIIEIWVNEGSKQTKLVFSGDLGAVGKPFVVDPSVIADADYLILESTYANRHHKDSKNRLEMLHDIVWETYRKGGNLIIPAFAVERTQDLLYDMNLLVKEDRFPPMDIFIDSPMAIAATEIFKVHDMYFDEDTKEMISRGENPLDMPNLKYSRSTEDSVALNNRKESTVIISASGMCEAGRIKHHLRHNLWRADSTVLFVGFQAPGTKGAKIVDGADFVRIHGEEIKVKADIRKIDGYSSHADQQGLIDWIGEFTSKPQKIFFVHGEPEAAGVLAELVNEKYSIDTEVPEWLAEYQITPGVVFTQEQVLHAQQIVQEKLQRILAKGTRQGEFSNIMQQLSDLEILLEKMEMNNDGGI